MTAYTVSIHFLGRDFRPAATARREPIPANLPTASLP
jgi:hypothetical protein